jgi:hypothetical protein
MRIIGSTRIQAGTRIKGGGSIRAGVGIQACDVGVFAPLKAAYRDQAERQYRGGANTVGKEHFTSLYSLTRERAFTKRNITAASKHTVTNAIIDTFLTVSMPNNSTGTETLDLAEI